MERAQALERLTNAGFSLADAESTLNEAERLNIPFDVQVRLCEKMTAGQGETRVYGLDKDGHVVDTVIA